MTIQPVTGGNFVNGSVIVSVDKDGVITNHKIPPKVNQDLEALTQSGTLTGRFDDPRYYTGDTAS